MEFDSLSEEEVEFMSQNRKALEFYIDGLILIRKMVGGYPPRPELESILPTFDDILNYLRSENGAPGSRLFVNVFKSGIAKKTLSIVDEDSEEVPDDIREFRENLLEELNKLMEIRT